VLVVIKGNFVFNPLGPLRAMELLRSVQWNLCLADPDRIEANLPDICWYVAGIIYVGMLRYDVYVNTLPY
jgi:hypothetical protein